MIHLAHVNCLLLYIEVQLHCSHVQAEGKLNFVQISTTDLVGARPSWGPRLALSVAYGTTEIHGHDSAVTGTTDTNLDCVFDKNARVFIVPKWGKYAPLVPPLLTIQRQTWMHVVLANILFGQDCLGKVVKKRWWFG